MAEPTLLELVSTKKGNGQFDPLIHESEYHFQKLEDLFRQFMTYDITNIGDQLTEDAIKGFFTRGNFSNENFLSAFEGQPQMHGLLLLIGKIAAYCDDKAYNKRIWNEYRPYRVLAKAMVTMPRWITGFLKYKVSGITTDIEPSVQNAILYIENPGERLTMLSDNHRKLFSENVLNKPFDSASFDKEVIAYFGDLNIKVSNPKNLGNAISRILYDEEVRNYWYLRVTGLLAADATGWQDHAISEAAKENKTKFLLWNSKMPSGGYNVLEKLREAIDDYGHFDLLYSSGGYARYLAKVTDFATEDDFDSKHWGNQDTIYGYSDEFDDYIDGNKAARIVFLASEFQKMDNPIPKESLKLHRGYSYPVHDNLSPIENIKPIGGVVIAAQLEKTISFMSLNTILYGPPGTGKTYHTINKALQIVDPAFYNANRANRDALNKRFYDLTIRDWENQEGQIVFLTFHQNYSYEEFIQGLRPDISGNVNGLSFIKKDGVFKKLADRALSNKLASQNKERLEPTFEAVFNIFFKDLIEKGEPIRIQMESEGFYFDITDYNIDGNYLPFKKKDGDVAHNISVPTLKELYEGTREIKGLKYYYTPLVKEMKAVAAEMVSDKPVETLKRYVIVIDEINRANISRVFGELITLIESDKRWGGKEQMKLTLPSGDEFTIPNNLYIIGTMNTADKSIALLDIALRRRFSFEAMYPDETKVHSSYQVFFDKLNEIIYNDKGADFTIGHSYFMSNADGSPPDFATAMNEKVIPLLQEYYYAADKGRVKEIVTSAMSGSGIQGFNLADSRFGFVKMIHVGQ